MARRERESAEERDGLREPARTQAPVEEQERAPSSADEARAAVAWGDGGAAARAAAWMQRSVGNAQTAPLLAQAALQRQPTARGDPLGLDDLPDMADMIVGPAPASNQPFDMHEHNWDLMSKPSGGIPLPELRLQCNTVTPKVPWKSMAEMMKDPKFTRLQHNFHHKQQDESPAVVQRRREYWDEGNKRLKYEDMRPKAWARLVADVNKLRVGYTRARPLVNAFEQAEKDKTLQEAEIKLQPWGKDESGDLPSLADKQIVPRTNSVRMEDLFKGGKGGVQPTSELSMTREETKGIDKASKSSTVDMTADKTAAADRALSGALNTYGGVSDKYVAAGHELQAAIEGVQILEAKDEQDKAQSALSDVEKRRAEAKEALGTILSVVKGVALLGAGVPLAMSGAKGDTLGGMVGGNVEPIGTSLDLIGVIGGAIVDSSFQAEIAAAQKKLDEAIAEVHKHEKAQAQSLMLAKQSAMAGVQKDLLAARDKVAEAYILRRVAYEQLGHVASEKSGVSADARAKICAYIAAIPVMDIVVSRAAEMRIALMAAADLPYSEESGRAFGILMAGDWPSDLTFEFTFALGKMRYYRDQIMGLEPFYRDRLASLRTVVSKLGGLATEPSGKPTGGQ